MLHIHHEHALSVLHAQPFREQQMQLLEAAAACLPWEDLSAAIEQLQLPATAEAGKNAVYEQIAELDKAHNGLAGVCVFAAAMYATGVRLHAQGVSRQVLYDTFCCLQRTMDDYEKKFGVTGFDRGFWIWRQASGIIMRLGTLEFEYQPALSESTAAHTGLKAGQPVLNVHIPGAADLSREALDASYAMARAFYREYPFMCLNNGGYPQGIMCHSWLLSPTLRTLLKENSGIRRFAEDFTLTHSESESKGCYYFLFRVREDTPTADLPEDTSLRRAVKAYLMAGGGIGSGYGLLSR